MSAQEFLTSVNVSYTLFMIAVLLLVILVFITSKSARKR